MLKPAFFLPLLLLPYVLAADPSPLVPAERPQLQDRVDLLNNSPWALVTQATMDDPAETDMPPPVLAPPSSANGPGVAGQPNAANGGVRWDGAIVRRRKGHLATIPVLVRWDSAEVMRQALAREHADLPAGSAEHFVITVIGLFPAKQLQGKAQLAAKSSSNEETGTRGAEETLEWFMGHSHLMTKGQPTLEPQNVKINPDTGDVHISFRRVDEWRRGKRDVVFTTRYGSMNVQARFRTKDMTAAGQADL